MTSPIKYENVETSDLNGFVHSIILSAGVPSSRRNGKKNVNVRGFVKSVEESNAVAHYFGAYFDDAIIGNNKTASLMVYREKCPCRVDYGDKDFSEEDYTCDSLRQLEKKVLDGAGHLVTVVEDAGLHVNAKLINKDL